MAGVAVLGAGRAGHTAASSLRKWLDRRDKVAVLSPLDPYNWIPSNIRAGVGLRPKRQVTIPLPPVYERNGIDFEQAGAVDDSGVTGIVEQKHAGDDTHPVHLKPFLRHKTDENNYVFPDFPALAIVAFSENQSQDGILVRRGHQGVKR